MTKKSNVVLECLKRFEDELRDKRPDPNHVFLSIPLTWVAEDCCNQGIEYEEFFSDLMDAEGRGDVQFALYDPKTEEIASLNRVQLILVMIGTMGSKDTDETKDNIRLTYTLGAKQIVESN